MQNSPARGGIDVGSVIAETYTIEALIGRGGMGAVFLASHKRLPGKKVAIKLLHADLSGDEILARFKREAEIASRLGHPNIVGVMDYNVMPDGTPYVVLDYLEGAPLSAHIKEGPLALDRVMSIVRQVGSALAAAHREGIVHRDLKPQNIFLVPSESEGRPVDVAKVLDFGIAKIRGSDTVKTQDSTLLGTPQYMAPEQATGQHDKVDERTDLFALGAIVHEMITGQPAFSGANIPEVVFKVVYEQPAPLPAGTPPHVVAAVERAMAKKQDQRYLDVGAFVEALTGQPLVVARTPSIPPTGGKTPSRNTGKEAFDQTVGSGDHGPTALPAPKTDERARELVITDAPTLGTESAPPAAQKLTSTPPAAPTSRAPLIALIAGGLAIAAGIAFFVASRRGSHDDAPAKPEAKTAVVDEKPEPVAVEPPKQQVAAPPTGSVPQTPEVETPPAPPKRGESPKPPAKHEAKAETATKVAETAADDDTTPASPDDETPNRLAAAETALASRDYARAEQLANAVINGEHSKPGQLARAHVVHGIVECAAHNDRGLALADLRAISAPRLKRKLAEGCQGAGMTLDE